jgi:signal transduction histidine kinase
MPEHTSFQALIRRVSFANDSVIYNGTQTAASSPADPAGQSIPFRFNSLRFDYAVPFYANPRANEFRSRLEGFEKSWSTWKRETRREYTNLPAGKYRFHVQAKNIFNQESLEAIYAFTILRPWYSSWWAWLGYVFFAIVAVYGLVRYRTRKLQARSKTLEKIVEQRTAQIQEQKNNVEQLSRIGKDITSSLSIENIIQTVYENVNTLMDASVFTIGLHKPEENVLEFPAAIEKNRLLPPFSVPLNDENRLGAWCFNHRQEVIINDYERDYRKYVGKMATPIAGETPESILYLPLWNKEKVIGVISAQSFSKDAYTDYHLNMLRNLATYSAIALENADAYRRLATLLDELKTTQNKLITQSKLAALGSLTAGIAHEIKNPLNFVNNFAGLNLELIEELQGEVIDGKENIGQTTLEEIKNILNTLKQNSSKIREHGKRADSIVYSMLQHSRGGSGEPQSTDINALLEEAINLTYHGMRAQYAGFNISIEKSFDESIGKMQVIPQELSRAFLNIISNGCFEAHRKKMEMDGDFSPTITVHTQKLGKQVKISIRDNGNGIPEAIREKLFTPFFTTKPAGQGTGLGLSIAYDIIVHQHKGQISFKTEEDSFTEFVILLPYIHA